MCKRYRPRGGARRLQHARPARECRRGAEARAHHEPCAAESLAAHAAATHDAASGGLAVADGFAQLLPRSARQPCGRHHHGRHHHRRFGADLEHDDAFAQQQRFGEPDELLRPGKQPCTNSGMDPTKLVNMGSATSNTGAGSVNRSEAINLTLGRARHPDPAQRQHGDRRPSAGEGQRRNARPAALRRRAHGRHHADQYGQSQPRSPKRASPMAARARSPTCSSRATVRSCSIS